jgi:hypothetical protein
MSPLSPKDAFDGRKSDEKHIMSATAIEREGSQSSAERIDTEAGWPLTQGQGITRKVEVDIQVSSHSPRSIRR